MEIEIEKPGDRPTKLLHTILENESFRRSILSPSPERDDVLDIVANRIGTYTKEENETLVKTILNGLSREDGIWNQDSRDVALTLFELVSFDKMDQQFLLNTYLGNVRRLSEGSDPYGSVNDLINAGKEIVFYFPRGTNTVEGVRSDWQGIAAKFRGEISEFIEKEVVSSLIPYIPTETEALDEDERLGVRERPNFEPEHQVLHDAYLREVAKRKTFKLALWDSTPEFRKLCAGSGISLEKFWNLNNPDEVAGELTDIQKEEPSYLRDSLNRSLLRNVGMTLDQLTPELARVTADEIITSAREALEELEKSAGDFDNTIDRFRALLPDLDKREARGQRSLLRAIAKFFSENGLEVTENVEAISKVFGNQELLTRVKGSFNRRRQLKLDSAETIKRTFRLSERKREFSLSSRTREDLFLGDLTGDCTAYHLNIGMNAWTVPVWLSNPGFNFYKIFNEEGLVAKLGIVLAVSDGEPALVVDSIETGKSISDEKTAGEAILVGLKFLKEWAQSSGFSKVHINTFSNSSDLPNFLDRLTKSSSTAVLEAIGGLDGVAELRRNLIGEDSWEEEEIYLQTKDWDDIEYGTRFYEEQQRLIGEFEVEIRGALERVFIKEDRENMESLARSLQWTELFAYVIKYNYPIIWQVLGDNWGDFKGRFLDKMEVEHGAIKSRGTQSFREREELLNELGLSATDADPDDIGEEVSELQKFFEVLKLMEFHDVSVSIALKRLYEKMTVDAENKFLLNSTLPVLG